MQFKSNYSTTSCLSFYERYYSKSDFCKKCIFPSIFAMIDSAHKALQPYDDDTE